jgi:hypothetical protein
MKIDKDSIFNTVIATLVATALITLIGYLIYIPVLKSQIEDIKTSQSAIPSQVSTEINQLTSRVDGLERKSVDIEKKYYLLAGFLQAKLNFNVQAFVDIAVNKGIPPQQLKAAVPVFESSPKNINSYLQNNLQFTPAEAKAVMTMP